VTHEQDASTDPQPVADEPDGPYPLAGLAARVARPEPIPTFPRPADTDYVVARTSPLWFLWLWLPPLLTGVLVFAVSTLGGIARLAFDPQVTSDQRLTFGIVAASTVLIGFIAFCFSVSMPTELRVSEEGIRARGWRDANDRLEGRFFELEAEPRFELVGSGSYLTAPGREPVRVRLPMLAMRMAARRAGVPVVLYPSWWAWRLLGWVGLFMWWVVPWLGGSMLLAGLIVRTFSSLRGQVLNEAD